jgi:hypothetical protein
MGSSLSIPLRVLLEIFLALSEILKAIRDRIIN